MERVGVVGIGCWGTALGEHFARHHYQVLGWTRQSELVQDLNKTKINERYFPGFTLSRAWEFTADLGAVLACDLVIFAVPSKYFTTVDLKPYRGYTPTIVSAVKGLVGDCETPLRYLSKCLPNSISAVLSGPSFARDLLYERPIGVVVASHDVHYAHELASSFTMGKLRAYASDDVIGVEYGGILKNVIAIAAGISDGLGLGDSARAAIVTRGLVEITRFAVSKGARPETLTGLSGLGDLLMTCTCDSSRNRRFGLSVGAGGAWDVGDGTVEGVRTLSLVAEIARKKSISMPILEVLESVYRGNLMLEDSVRFLLDRSVKYEAG